MSEEIPSTEPPPPPHAPPQLEESPLMVPQLPELLLTDITRRFTYHPPKGDQGARYDIITGESRDFAILICQLCPDSRERATALTLLSQVRMMANAAIACNE